ncbi:hypothetical protein CHS0354_039040 [Potamilus streckersoni]|uniref:Uncharacterized protein n=1 Tax=Potamilus streckersoni TaxID=2493646 RepID=A0AAE0RRD0_9BIVA|nr:hypothetical protein CHS0354_039040 [Potamilus streckersoni]
MTCGLKGHNKRDCPMKPQQQQQQDDDQHTSSDITEIQTTNSDSNYQNDTNDEKENINCLSLPEPDSENDLIESTKPIQK